jgi:hypothetical protein
MKPALFLALLATLLLLGGCTTGCMQVALHEQTTTFDVAHVSGKGLRVETNNGAIAVRAAGQEEVTITATLRMTSSDRLERTTISAQRTDAGVLEIAAIPPDGGWRGREGCSFEILIPDTGEGGVRARTSNGRIELAGLGGPATLRTSNGRITVDRHDGAVSATSSNGAIVARDFTGPLRASTSNGAITARPAAESPGPLDLRTSNGAIALELPRQFAGRLDMRTSNGSVRVAEALNARLHRSGRSSALVSLGDPSGGEVTSEIRTSNGRITVVLHSTTADRGP